MIGWMKSLWKVGRTRTSAARLREVEAELADSTGAYAAPVHMRAAALAAEIGDRSQSLKYFGEAIDGLIEAGRFEAAAAACRTLLRTHPDAVRAMGTLIWLEIGAGRLYEAEPLIHRYAKASRAKRKAELAKKQLAMLADIVGDVGVRTALADALDVVGEPRRAAFLRRDIESERLGQLPPREFDGELVWQTLQRATLRHRCGEERGSSITSALIIAPEEHEESRTPTLRLVS
jgi:hypothetical protein